MCCFHIAFVKYSFSFWCARSCVISDPPLESRLRVAPRPSVCLFVCPSMPMSMPMSMWPTAGSQEQACCVSLCTLLGRAAVASVAVGHAGVYRTWLASSHDPWSFCSLANRWAIVSRENSAECSNIFKSENLKTDTNPHSWPCPTTKRIDSWP